MAEFLVGSVVYKTLKAAQEEAERELKDVKDRGPRTVYIWQLAGKVVVDAAPVQPRWEPVK